MNLFSISMRNLRTRALSSTLTTLAIALGAGLLAALWLLLAEAERKYKTNVQGFGVVVGPNEGSALDLVLSTVFNFQELAPPTGLLPLSVYEELRDGRLRKRFPIKYAIPQCRGDNYRGFPVIGTTDEMFSEFSRGTRGRDEDGDAIPNTLRFAAGEPFAFGHDDLMAFAREQAREHGGGEAAQSAPGGHGRGIPESWRQAVVGAAVARRLGLSVGSRITPVHGVADEVSAHLHAEAECTVVGVLEATGAPLDRSIFIPIGTFLSIEDHDAIRASQEAVAGNVGLSAVVVQTIRPAFFGPRLRYDFQTRTDAQAAVPQVQIVRLLKVVGDASQVLRVTSYLVLVVAAISILVALYNTMNERRREIAIMRSLGARQSQILWVIVQEAVLIAFGGAVLGVALCHAAAFFLADLVADYTSVPIDWAAFSIAELWLILGVVILGAVAGVLPAVKGSMTQVADSLAPTN